MSRPAPAGPTRRDMLVGGAVLALAGCLPADQPEPRAAVLPEVRVRARIAAEVSSLSLLYTAVLGRFPEARPELATLAAEHDAHVVALLGPGARRTATATTPAPSAAPAPAVPDTLVQARAALVTAERAASRRRARQARRATPALARLLASISACGAAHAALLEQDA